MKIGYLISTYLPKVGGAEVFIHNLAKGIAAKGHETVVITPSRGGANDKVFKYKIVRLNPLLNRLLFINFKLGKIYFEKLLYRLQKKYEFDIWHVTIGYPLGAAAADFFNRNKISCVLRCAGEDIQMLPELGYGYRLNKRVERIVKENYRKFSALITASDGMKDDYISLGIPEDKIFVIPNGVDCAKFGVNIDRRRIRSELGISDNQKLIITVGRNHPKKGFKHIPQIAKELIKRGAEFRWLLVGRGSEDIKAIADKEGVGEYLIIKEVNPGASGGKEPEIPNKELIKYYNASDIFVFPTLIELFTKVLIEAMAAGLPVVTTDAPGTDNVIRDNENGLKSRRGDIKGLSESILRLLSDEILAKRLGDNALRDSKNYDWSRITDGYLELYKELLHL
jgi:glycosyltransferase involved in cell wall biosynthesis